MTIPRFAAALAAALLLASWGCAREPRTPEPMAETGGTEVIGTLVAMKDDRPVDGGIDLRLETAPGDTALVRVGSIFIVPPRDSVRAMHEVVDSARIGNRLRAWGVRDETGALQAKVLELLR